MNRKENYADMERYNRTKRTQQRRHRSKYGSGQYPSREWTEDEDKLVLEHNMPDAELGIKIRRSQNAIYIRRAKLNKDLKESK